MSYTVAVLGTGPDPPETVSGESFAQAHRHARRTGRESNTSARRAPSATGTITPACESARRRGRVDLPLTVADDRLVGMGESGAFASVPADGEGDR